MKVLELQNIPITPTVYNIMSYIDKNKQHEVSSNDGEINVTRYLTGFLLDSFAFFLYFDDLLSVPIDMLT